MGGRASCKTFTFNSSRLPPVSCEDFASLKAILSAGDYANTISDAMLASAQAVRPLPLNVFTKIREGLIVIRAMKASHKFSMVEKQVTDRYAKGEGILKIASSLDQPAMACFRAVLKRRGLSKVQIKAGSKGSKTILTEARDVSEQRVAAEHDDATTEAAHVATSSKDFERHIQSFLDRHGVEYKTQNELKAHKLTPDFLLSSPVMFGESKVCWIDAKDFFGGTTDFMTKKTSAQATKYIEAFGPGTMIYSRGLTEAHRSELDSRCLTIDFRWLEDDHVVSHPIKKLKHDKGETSL